MRKRIEGLRKMARFSEPGSYEAFEKEEIKIIPELDVKGREVSCLTEGSEDKKTPIVVIFDNIAARAYVPHHDSITSSVIEKLPFVMKIKYQNYVKDPCFSVAAVGSASRPEDAPLQATNFKENPVDLRDVVYKMVFLDRYHTERCHEIAAYYYARHAQVDKKGCVFFVTDKKISPKIAKEKVKAVIGDVIPRDLETAEIFRELGKKFTLFLIQVKKEDKVRCGACGHVLRVKRRKTEDREIRIRKEWGKVIPVRNIFTVPNVKLIGEIIMGILAHRRGKRMFKHYISDLEMRWGIMNKERVRTVKRILNKK